MNTKKRISLVIGSGGVKCAAAIGLWQVLQEADIQVDSVVGCSGGSMYGALIANDLSGEQMLEWSSLLWTKDVMQGYTESLKASKDGSLRFTERSGLVDDSFLNNNLQKVYGKWNFSDLKLPLKVVATDFLTGEKVTLSEGNVFDAIRASVAIPIIFPPWEVDGRLLIDGAASDPLPIDVAIQDGADIIIAMGFTLDFRARFRSMTAVQEHLNSIYMNNILTSTYSFYNLAHHAEIFPVIPEFDGSVSMFDVDKLPDVVERGEQAARKQLPHIKKLLASL
ncbi:MAG: patatin-like phospholipase family protein [Anaerolineales bacterium]|nr:patatin-like phospholipase family protein [Anaerolineales bacterium]WKZ41865.1 MAG: patatin-like phospholipase family protein [Anaerolineales bacterium]